MSSLPQFFSIYTSPLLKVLPAVNVADLVIAANGDQVTTFRTHAYKLTNQGWGDKYSNPATSPTGRTSDSKFRPQGDAVGWALLSVSPRAEAYAFSASGYGSRYANMSTIPDPSTISFSWSPDGSQVLVGSTDSVASITGLFAYAWSSGWGSKYSNPVGLEPGGRASFAKNGSYIFTNELASPYLAAYAWSSSGFGSKFSDPAAAVESSSSTPESNYDNTVVIVGNSATPYVKAYAFSGAGWGSAFSAPTSKFTTQVVGSPSQVAFKSTDDYVAISHTCSISEFGCAIYSWSAGWGTLLSDPSTVDLRSYNGISWVGGTHLVVAKSTTPFLFMYQWSGSTWGTRLSGPVTQPSTTVVNELAVRLY